MTVGEKENFKYLGIVEADTIQQTDERKGKKRLRSKKKTSQNQFLQLKFHQRNEYLGSFFSKIVWTILKMDKGGTPTDGSKDNEIDDDTQSLTLER